MVSEVQLCSGLSHFSRKGKPLRNFCKLFTSLGVAKETGKVWLLNIAPQNFLVKLIFCYGIHWDLIDSAAMIQLSFCCCNKRVMIEEWKHWILKSDLESTSIELAPTFLCFCVTEGWVTLIESCRTIVKIRNFWGLLRAEAVFSDLGIPRFSPSNRLIY